MLLAECSLFSNINSFQEIYFSSVCIVGLLCHNNHFLVPYKALCMTFLQAPVDFVVLSKHN